MLPNQNYNLRNVIRRADESIFKEGSETVRQKQEAGEETESSTD